MPKSPVWAQGLLGFAALAALSSQAARATTNGTFTVDWTDRAGNTHPLTNTQVSLYDTGLAGGDHLIGTWVTDSSGRLNYSTSYTRADGTPFQVQLDVKAIVTSVGQFGSDYSTVFTYRLPSTFAVTPNVFNPASSAGAVTNASDGGKAIGFLQGLQVASNFYRSLGANVSSVNGRFASQWGDGSYMNGWNMTLGYDSWGAWDVAIHEFGHGIASANHLQISPTVGYVHSFNNDAMNPPANNAVGLVPLSAANATQLAWQEGMATYLGTSALNYSLPSSIAGMPGADSNASYDRYSSVNTTTPDSSASFNVQLENKTGVVNGVNYVINGKGETDELTVSRVLWDLYDNTPGETLCRPGHTDQLSLGPQGVFDLLKAVGQDNNGRLNDLWRVARAAYGVTPQARTILGDIFEANSVSAIPGAPGGVADGGTTTSLSPVLAWTPQDSGHSGKYLVAVYSADWSTLLELSPQLDGLTSWQLATPLALGTYNWAVISNSVMQTSVDFDNSYWSGAATFSIVPEPVSLAVIAAGLAPVLLLRRRPRTAAA